MDQDWLSWHEPYDQQGSSLQRRLTVVQARIRSALDEAPAGPTTVISMCAGQGRDLLDVLADHPRRADVHARLVELDPRNTARAREAAAGLDTVEIVTGDAAQSSAYSGMVPADIVLVCGVFGNISDADVEHIVSELPGFCRNGATVIWTRHHGAPDLTPRIRAWFAEAGFAELAFDTEDGYLYSVGTYRFTGEARPLRPDVQLFNFIGNGVDAHR